MLNEAIKRLSVVSVSDVEKNEGMGDMTLLKTRQAFLLALMVSEYQDQLHRCTKHRVDYANNTDISIVLYLENRKETTDLHFPMFEINIQKTDTLPPTTICGDYTLTQKYVFTGKHREEDCFEIFLSKMIDVIKSFTKEELEELMKRI